MENTRRKFLTRKLTPLLNHQNTNTLHTIISSYEVRIWTPSLSGHHDHRANPGVAPYVYQYIHIFDRIETFAASNDQTPYISFVEISRDCTIPACAAMYSPGNVNTM